MKSRLREALCRAVLQQARGLCYQVSDHAPASYADLRAETSLTVWSGASDATVFGDAAVNWAFRAWHDSLHLAHQLDFTLEHELELARRQASCIDSVEIAEIVYWDVAGQALYQARFGQFPLDQQAFHREKLWQSL